MRRLLLMTALLALSACTNRTFAPYVADVPQNTVQSTILTITSRDMNDAGDFTSERAKTPRYFENVVSIPPSHEAGKVELAYNNPDPNRHFVIAEQNELASKSGFSKALRAQLAKRAPKNREVIVFLHGYNSSYTDSMFRVAQLQNDLQIPGVMINYSWPSAANPLGYSHDRDSVLFARDSFQNTLELIRASTDAPIVIVAHSLGGLLVMETLRQKEIQTPGWSKRALAGLVLIAPDISLDVFKKQASRFKALPQPFAIFTSRKDPALRLSARVNGNAERLGNLANPDELGDLPVTLIDVTQFSKRSSDKHFVPGTSPALISLLRRSEDLEAAFSSEASGRAGLLPGTVITVRKATQLVLSPGLIVQQ